MLERLLDGTGASAYRGSNVVGEICQGNHPRWGEETSTGRPWSSKQPSAGRIVAGSPWQQAMIVAHQAALQIELGQPDAAATLLDEADELLQILGGSVFDDYVAEQRARL